MRFGLLGYEATGGKMKVRSDFDPRVHAKGRHSRPVVVMKGTRQVPPEQKARLAVTLPRSVFRSGNAQGSDTLFFQGLQGIGHSICVCHHLGVPVYTQDEWGGFF